MRRAHALAHPARNSCRPIVVVDITGPLRALPLTVHDFAQRIIEHESTLCMNLVFFFHPRNRTPGLLLTACERQPSLPQRLPPRRPSRRRPSGRVPVRALAPASRALCAGRSLRAVGSSPASTAQPRTSAARGRPSAPPIPARAGRVAWPAMRWHCVLKFYCAGMRQARCSSSRQHARPRARALRRCP